MPHYTPTSPTVSVLMDTHDGAASVRRAVESVQNQTLANVEIIVVADQSNEALVRSLESVAERDLRVQLVCVDGCGRQEALDLALSRAQGTYFTVMDADGLAAPRMLELLVDAAEKGALDVAVGGVELRVSGSGGREGAFELTDEGVTYPTQHDFRADAWRLFGSGQLLPASGKLFSTARARELGIGFAGRPTDHFFVIDYLRDVERVGVLPGTCYRVDRALPDEGPHLGLEGYKILEGEYAALLGLYRHWGLEGDAASMAMLQGRYMERLVTCIEAVCGTGSRLGSAEQRSEVARMIGSEHAELAASVARPRSNQARSLMAPIRSRNVGLVCVQARLISLLRGGRIADAVPDVFL